VDRFLTEQVQVDDSRSDMCHHCKGNTWHICTTDVVGPYIGTTCGRCVDWAVVADMVE
jgi:hypothetical protein